MDRLTAMPNWGSICWYFLYPPVQLAVINIDPLGITLPTLKIFPKKLKKTLFPFF
jgi:hypothetical protein